MSIDTVKDTLNLDHFEIAKSATGIFASVTTSNPGAGNYALGHASTTIAHGLGYSPVILAFLTINSTRKTYPMPLNVYTTPSSSTAGWLAFELYADETNVYLLTDVVAYGASFSTAADTYQAQYYLMKDRVKR